ncbi:DUF4913 domain-containing protein [Nocardiopsis alba]|uniref:DUF4913 domain-containing protein n=1 Tax=Nocardiopsis alba TaxID=53437 RepID=UPI0036720F96
MSSTDEYEEALAEMLAFVEDIPENAEPSNSPASSTVASIDSISTGWGDRQPEGEGEQTPELYYGSVDEFVREVILPMYRRKVGSRGSRRWSAQWWRDAEAIARLEALWRAWENLRLDGATGMSTWWRDHADYHMNILFDPEGPFGRSEDENKPGAPLPYDPPPPGLFHDVRTTQTEEA